MVDEAAPSCAPRMHSPGTAFRWLHLAAERAHRLEGQLSLGEALTLAKEPSGCDKSQMPDQAMVALTWLDTTSTSEPAARSRWKLARKHERA